MRKLYFILIFGNAFSFLCQGPERLIPCQAVTVFSINNTDLLQKLSVDEWISYDFMDEIHQEIFDQSTENKSVKEAGLDFDKRLSLFYGKTSNYEITGFTFGIKDRVALFKIFDDFEEINTEYKNITVYQSLFNNLLIQNNNGLLIRIEPMEAYLNKITDSVWYARGNVSPFYEPDENELIFDDTTFQIENSFEILEKTYFELRDSVEFELQKHYYSYIIDDLLLNNRNLFSQDSTFRELLTHESPGVFFMDNSRNIDRANSLWYLKTILPTLFLDVQELYEGNIITGDLTLKTSSIQFDLTAKYGSALGSIYTEMNDAKFDKNILKYIKKDQPAYFTYTINLRSAYEKTFEVLVPLLSKAHDPDVSFNLLMLKLGNELINKDALFDAYKGGLFATFNGIQKVKTKKITFVYDEQTFEYSEIETETEEDMPILTVGFSTKRQDIPEMILDHFSKITSKFEKKEGYWVFQKAIFDAAPLYMLNSNGLFIITNDRELAENHRQGYGDEALTKNQIKALKHSGSISGFADISKVAQKFPTDFIEPSQQKLMDFLQSKSGKVTLISGATTKKSTSLHLNYSYNDNEISSKHFLDLLNTIYLLTR